MLIRLIFSIILSFMCISYSYSDELITDFEDNSLPVLNEELRKIKNDISGANSVIVQSVRSSTSSIITCSTTMPYDNTLPVNTEGNEVLSVDITPSSSSNVLKIYISVTGCMNSQSDLTFALFQDSNVNAICAWTAYGVAAHPITNSYIYYIEAGTISATTFKLHIGGNSNIFYVNGTNSGNSIYDGNSYAIMIVEEILV